MQTWFFFAIIIGALVIAIGAVVIVIFARTARTAQGPAMRDKYPQGHWMSIGMSIGVALGCLPMLAGIFSDDTSSWVALGPVLGCGIGVAIGSALEHKHKDELRPLTEQEQQSRFRITLIGLGALALLVLGLFVLGGIALFTPR